MSSLFGNGMLSKNLRTISQLDLVYSGYKIESLLLHSMLLGESFVYGANVCKLSSDYKR